MPTRHTTPPISPLPGQEDQSARLAASAQVDQVEGTTCPHCGKALTPSADVFDRIAGFPFEKCSCQVEGTIYRPIGEYVDWLFAELARLDGMPSSPDYPSYRECQAALRVYMRFVDHRLGRA